MSKLTELNGTKWNKQIRNFSLGMKNTLEMCVIEASNVKKLSI